MDRITPFRLVSAIFVLVLPAFPESLPQGVQKVVSLEGITEYAFPNGLHVLSVPDPSKPKVTVNITYLVGSRHEGYGETGMAHLLEHLMFLQTKNRTNIKRELTDHGATMNGATSWDRTNYFETINATDENLRWALELEADRMVNTRMEKTILDKEMTVVRNEFEMGENNPTNMMFQRVLETAYLWHNYGHLPIGNRSDIENVPIARLAAFYRKYYQPDVAVLTIAGKFDEANTLQWVAETLGRIPRPARTLETTYTIEPTQDGERSVTLRRAGDTQAVASLYHVPSASHPDTAALEVLAGVLGDSPSGRLYKSLVDSKKAVQVAMVNLELWDPGVLIAFAILRQEQPIENTRQALVKTIEGLVNEPPSKEEVERQKTRLLKQIDLAMANTESLARTLGEAVSAGDWRLLFYGRDELKKITEQDVLRVAKAYLKPSNRTLGEFIPTKSSDRAEIAAAPDLATTLKNYKGSEAISKGEAFDLSPANIESRVIRAKLANGMKLVLLPKKSRGGTVNVQMRMRYGDEKSVFGRDAAAQLAGAVLIRGTRNKSRQQIQDELDGLKAEISMNSSATSTSASIQTIEDSLRGALRLVAEMLRQPSFPENEFEQVRQQRLAVLEGAKSEPQALAPLELNRHLRAYPRGDSRYVGTIEEQIEDLKKVTLDEARKFHVQFYGTTNAELVIVGQFDPVAIQKLAAELFGDWRSPSRFERLPMPYSQVDSMVRKIDTPDKQTAFLAGGMTTQMAMEDADYAATILANRIFGGTFSSRIVHRIRDEEGLSYSVNSGFTVNGKDDGATFTMTASCAPQNLPKVEAAFREELTRALKGGFTATEVAAEKKAWLEHLAVQRTQDGSLASTLLNREQFDRTMKFDQDMETKIRTLTVEQVNDAFRQHVDPVALTFVSAGDFKNPVVPQ